MTLFCIRHGETVWNRERRIQGSLDSALTARGVRLAVAYAAHLRGRLPESARLAIHSSPQARAYQTAVLVAETLGQDPSRIRGDDRLRERSFGRLEGLTADEIRDRAGISRAAFRAWDFRPPEGETPGDVLERVGAWIREPRSETISIVVCHGGVSRALRAAHLGLDARGGYAELGSHDHGRYFELRKGGIDEHVVDEPISTAPDAPFL